MKKKNIVRIIIIALFVIGIAVALLQYKREQTALEQPDVGEEPETVVLSADENPFGVEIKKINEDYDLTKNDNRNLLGGLYRENPVKSRNYEAVKSSKKWENVGNSYIIPALLLYRYSYI